MADWFNVVTWGVFGALSALTLLVLLYRTKRGPSFVSASSERCGGSPDEPTSSGSTRSRSSSRADCGPVIGRARPS
ncbi:MAG TPA: hypothetical protein VGG32_08765 [Thermoplasmata archaeon]